MCDFRQAPQYVKNKDSGAVKFLVYFGHFPSVRDVTNPEFGIYHVGMSGCGYNFYDGTEWLHIDDNHYEEIDNKRVWVDVPWENEKYLFGSDTNGEIKFGKEADKKIPEVFRILRLSDSVDYNFK